MALTKHASFTVLAARIAHAGEPLMRTAHRVEFTYEPKPGFLYVRSRAISSRCNDNYDEFPAEEIKKAYRTFIGKPVFVNHHNANHRRARGVIIDAALHEDVNPDGTPDTWAEVLMEVDAIKFPRLAAAIVKGDIERTSMGTDVAFSVCSACGNKAASPVDYCQHIPKMKGKRIYRTTASGTKEGVLVREICYGLGFFENSLLVEEPADPTAYFLGVDTRGLEMAGVKTAAKTAAGENFLHPFRAPATMPDGSPAVWFKGGSRRTWESFRRSGLETVHIHDFTQGHYYAVSQADLDAKGTDYAGRNALEGFQIVKRGPGVADWGVPMFSEDARTWKGHSVRDWLAAAEGKTASKDETVAPSTTKDPERYQGVTIAQDDDGFYVRTHRARSDSYPSPEEIPAKDIEFIESTGARKVAAKTAITFDQGGRTTAPAEVDTMRDEQCPVCGETDSYDGQECQVCGFVSPPAEFGDPDLSKAKQVDLRQDGEQAEGDRLKCDSCSAVFSGGTKVAVFLDKSKDDTEAQGTDTAMAAGDTCPECGQGTLQADGADPAVDAATDDDGFAPAGSAEEAADDGFAPAGSAQEEPDDDDNDDETSDEDTESEPDEEDGDKPDFLKKKKPTAARRGSTRRSTVEMTRPALAALAEQQKQINTIAEALVTLADAAGVGAHPKFAALRRTAADENPAQPSGWANPSGEGTEAPTETTEQAATPAATDDPTSVGASPLTDVSPAATTDVTQSSGTVLDEPLDLNEQDPTKQVAGTDDLGEGARGNAGSGRTETEVRAGTPSDGGAAFQDGGFLSAGAALGERTIASLRLARLQIQAGIAAGDDLGLSQTIAASDKSDEVIAAEISTLAAVVAARPTQAAERRPVARSLVPQPARTAGRVVPSLSAEGAVAMPVQEVSTAVSDAEVLFE